MIKGIIEFIKKKSSPEAMHPVYDFFARYVRKLHSDRYIKKTLIAHRGKSYLDLIGPSDIVYVICLIKNSIAVWRHDVTDTSTAPPKALFTRGESKKREFGKTTWSNEGMNYFNTGLKNWKRMFDRSGVYYCTIRDGWDTWLADGGNGVNSSGWIRKDLRDLLATRREEENIDIEDNKAAASDVDSEDGYDSDDPIGPALVGFGELGGERGVGRGIIDEEKDHHDHRSVGFEREGIIEPHFELRGGGRGGKRGGGEIDGDVINQSAQATSADYLPSEDEEMQEDTEEVEEESRMKMETKKRARTRIQEEEENEDNDSDDEEKKKKPPRGNKIKTSETKKGGKKRRNN